jgi:hypothetical protein
MPGGRSTYPLLLMAVQLTSLPRSNRVTAGQCWTHQLLRRQVPGHRPHRRPPAPDAGWLPAPTASPPHQYAGRLALVGIRESC